MLHVCLPESSNVQIAIGKLKIVSLRLEKGDKKNKTPNEQVSAKISTFRLELEIELVVVYLHSYDPCVIDRAHPQVWLISQSHLWRLFQMEGYQTKRFIN
jgi:hypothetical protein